MVTGGPPVADGEGAAEQGVDDPAAELAAVEGGVAGPAGQLGPVDRPGGGRVEARPGWPARPGATGPPWPPQPPAAGRPGGEPLDRGGQVQVAGLDQLGEGHGQGGLQPEHARRGRGPLDLLVLAGVGGVVGGDGVEGAVGQPLADGLDVGLLAQRRVDLEHRVIGAGGLVGQGEVVGGGLGGDPHPAGPGRPDQLDRAPGGDVAQVQPAAGQLGQQQVAGDHHLLGGGRPAGQPEHGRHLALVHLGAVGQRGVLGVVGDHRVEGPGVLEREPQQPGLADGPAVVGEAVDPGGRAGHGPQLGQLAPRAGRG